MKHLKPIIAFLASTLLAACTVNGDGKEDVRVEGVTLNETSLSLNEGDTFQLLATIAPEDATNQDVTWSSSNREFASVDSNGLVSAIKEGNTTITVTTVDGNFTAECDVTVVAPVILSSISLSNKTTSYTVNDSFVKPTVEATYSNGSTANVTNQTRFSGYDMSTVGTYTVTASYSEGGVSVTADYQISVNAKQKVLTSISLSNKVTEFNVGDQFVKPTVTATFDDNSTLDVTSDSTFSGYDMSKAGTYTVVVKYKYNDVEKAANYSIEVVDSSSQAGLEFYLSSSRTLDIGSYVTLVGVSNNKNYVISTEQRQNNRGLETISVKNSTLTALTATGVFKVEEGTKTNTYSFYDEVNKGYIYAAGSGNRNNYLRTQESKTDNSSFMIEANDNGQVKLVAQGSSTNCVLRFNSSSNPKVFSCYSVSSTSGSLPYLYVNDGVAVYPTSISLSGVSEVAIGEDIKLSPVFEPSNTNKKTVTWESSATSVATVSNSGVVHGLSAGTTTITATALKEDGTPISASKQIEVKTVSVTGVTLNKSSSDLSLGKTLQLTATVSPSNATNKNVSWDSSDKTVATVSNSGLVTANSSKTGSVTITVTTEDGSKTASCVINVVEMALDEWTIMFYVSGSNLESEGGAATGDIKEVLSIANQPDDVNIVYQTGGTTEWQSMRGYIEGANSINAERSQRWEVQNQKIVLRDDTLGQKNMAASSTLQDYIKWGVSNYPAQKYALIFWNHGGAMQGCCVDDNYSYYSYDYLTNSETKTALSNVFKDSSLAINGNFEFVGYDCCVMQVQDIAEFNSHYFNYMVASEELENGDGWDYTAWIDDLYAKKTTPEILTAICDGFVDFYDKGEYARYGNDQTLSWLDLTAMPDYLSAWENMSKTLYNNIGTYGKSNFRSFLINKVKYFGTAEDIEGYTDCGIFDVKDFLTQIKKESTLYNGLSSLVSAVETAYGKLMKYSKVGSSAGRAYGLCFFFDSGSDCSPSTAYSTSQTNFVEWRKIVTKYGYNAK